MPRVGLWPTAALLILAVGCSGSGNQDSVRETVVTPVPRSGESEVTRESVFAAWTPANLIFATVMSVSLSGERGVHRIWSDADSGLSLRVVLGSDGAPSRATIVDSALRMTNVDVSGRRDAIPLAPDGVAPNVRVFPVVALLPPAGGLRDPRASWGPATVHPRGLALATLSGGPFEALLILDARTLFPLEYTLRQDGVTLIATFEDTRLIAATSQVKSLFDVKRLEDRLK